MPTFVAKSGVGDNYATFLMPMVDVQWFKSSFLGALYEMTNPDNWLEEGDVAVSFAVEEAAKMIANYRMTNFNPFPIGMIFPFGGTEAPPGYLLCDGAARDPADYPELAAVLGTAWGADEEFFYTPDLRNEFIFGAFEDVPEGTYGGIQDVTLTVDQMPVHLHNDLGHQHSYQLITSLPAQAGIGFAGDVTVPFFTNTTGVSYAQLDNQGGGQPHTNMPPFAAATYIIYAGRL